MRREIVNILRENERLIFRNGIAYLFAIKTYAGFKRSRKCARREIRDAARSIQRQIYPRHVCSHSDDARALFPDPYADPYVTLTCLLDAEQSVIRSRFQSQFR